MLKKLLIALFLLSGAASAEPASPHQTTPKVTSTVLPSSVKQLCEAETSEFLGKHFGANFFHVKCNALPKTCNFVALANYSKFGIDMTRIDLSAPSNNFNFEEMFNAKQEIIACFLSPKSETLAVVNVSFAPNPPSANPLPTIVIYDLKGSLHHDIFQPLFEILAKWPSPKIPRPSTLPAWATLVSETQKPWFAGNFFGTNIFYAKCEDLPKTNCFVALKYSKKPSLILETISKPSSFDFIKTLAAHQDILAHFSHPEPEKSAVVQVFFDPNNTTSSAIVIYYKSLKSSPQNILEILPPILRSNYWNKFSPQNLAETLKANLAKHGKTIGVATSLAMLAHISNVTYNNTRKEIPSECAKGGIYENYAEKLAKKTCAECEIGQADAFILDAANDPYFLNRASIPDNTQLVVVSAPKSSLVEALDSLNSRGLLQEDTHLRRIKVLVLSEHYMDIKESFKIIQSGQKTVLDYLKYHFNRTIRDFPSRNSSHHGQLTQIFNLLNWQIIILESRSGEDRSLKGLTAEDLYRELAIQYNEYKIKFLYQEQTLNPIIKIEDTRKPLLKDLGIEIETGQRYRGGSPFKLFFPSKNPLYAYFGTGSSWLGYETQLLTNSYKKICNKKWWSQQNRRKALNAAHNARCLLAATPKLTSYYHANSHAIYMNQYIKDGYIDGVKAGIRAAEKATQECKKFYANKTLPSYEELDFSFNEIVRRVPNPFSAFATSADAEPTYNELYADGYMEGANFEDYSFCRAINCRIEPNPPTPSTKPSAEHIKRPRQEISPITIDALSIEEKLNKLDEYNLYSIEACVYLNLTTDYVARALKWNNANPEDKVNISHHQRRLCYLYYKIVPRNGEFTVLDHNNLADWISDINFFLNQFIPSDNPNEQMCPICQEQKEKTYHFRECRCSIPTPICYDCGVTYFDKKLNEIKCIMCNTRITIPENFSYMAEL